LAYPLLVIAKDNGLFIDVTNNIIIICKFPNLVSQISNTHFSQCNQFIDILEKTFMRESEQDV